MFPKKADAEKLAGRIPPVIISTQELRELKIVKEPGALKQTANSSDCHKGRTSRIWPLGSIHVQCLCMKNPEQARLPEV